MALDLVHAYVTSLLREWFDLSEVVRDVDGDYPFRYGTATYYVRVLDQEPAVVRVFSVAVREVAVTADLLRELNDVNASIAFARVCVSGGLVWVEAELWADAMDAFALGMACERIGELADRIGPSLAAVYGGSTHFRLEDPEGRDPQDGAA
ncbi:MAG: T3SS (YopN, CesT) and YbjN peptide-binding chaperone 1 [Mycobacteriales bacterium]